MLVHVHSELSIFSSFNLYAVCSLEKHSERHYVVEVVFNDEDRGDARAVCTFLTQFRVDTRWFLRIDDSDWHLFVLCWIWSIYFRRCSWSRHLRSSLDRLFLHSFGRLLIFASRWWRGWRVVAGLWRRWDILNWLLPRILLLLQEGLPGKRTAPSIHHLWLSLLDFATAIDVPQR